MSRHRRALAPLDVGRSVLMSHVRCRRMFRLLNRSCPPPRRTSPRPLPPNATPTRPFAPRLTATTRSATSSPTSGGRCSGWRSATRSSSGRTRPRRSGWSGLMGALPIILLSIPAGIAADRLNRKGIILVTQLLSSLTSVGLTVLALEHLAVPAVGAARGRHAALCTGWRAVRRKERRRLSNRRCRSCICCCSSMASSRAFGWAARSALFPNLVPRAALSNAVMWNSSNFELTCVVGPALGRARHRGDQHSRRSMPSMPSARWSASCSSCRSTRRRQWPSPHPHPLQRSLHRPALRL